MTCGNAWDSAARLLFRRVAEKTASEDSGDLGAVLQEGREKAIGREEDLTAYNEKVIRDGDYSSEDDLQRKLEQCKGKFMEFDEDRSGDVDIMELKRMMERLGQAKTHLELKKMIAEVDTNNSGTINYSEFVDMMLGKKNSILKIILMFEEKKKGKERPTGAAPKRSLSDLP